MARAKTICLELDAHTPKLVPDEWRIITQPAPVLQEHQHKSVAPLHEGVWILSGAVTHSVQLVPSAT